MTNETVVEILEKHTQAFDLAISALKKQIPQKPKETPDKHSKNISYLPCPSCGLWVGWWDNRIKHRYVFNRYNRNICPYCGQAIDWEGES